MDYGVYKGRLAANFSEISQRHCRECAKNPRYSNPLRHASISAMRQSESPISEQLEQNIIEFNQTFNRIEQEVGRVIVGMRDIVRRVAPRIPEAQALFTDKLRQRLVEALGNASDDRILQEVAVFATRIDVAEELSRLTTHLDEVERVLKQGGACGKRLDFLMQELNREANTLGSKSAITEVSQASMDLKLLIEQMREQIQNLE